MNIYWLWPNDPDTTDDDDQEDDGVPLNLNPTGTY